MFCQKSVSGRIGSIAAGIFFLILTSLSAQETLPGWVLYEQGLLQFEEGNLAEALELITLSAGGGEPTPEALYWTGKIFEAEGDYLLAEKRYKEALAKSRFLYIPDEKWDIQYSLSDIYLNGKDFDSYEQVLLGIFDEEMQRNAEVIRREHSYVQALKSDGLDKLILLYRLKLRYSLEASVRLGRYYSSIGLWKSSLIKNLYPLLTAYTAGIETLINRNPDFSFPVDMDEAWEMDGEFLSEVYEQYCHAYASDYSFSRNLDSLVLDDVDNDVVRAERLIRTSFAHFTMTPSAYVLLKMEADPMIGKNDNLETLYSSLYFLGEALYWEGNSERAREIWTLLSMSSKDSSWKKLAFGKLTDPELETPFLKY